MMSLEEKIKEYKCCWIKSYLKELLHNKDLKTYNRAKCLLYYYPEILNTLTVFDFKIAIQHANETYIYIGEGDTRYAVFDNIYKKKNGKKFELVPWGETRYVTIDDIYKYFKI